ncbi:MAG: PD-(D/E)XK nuclease family protein [Candidatus Krumholzibacteriia bacterium]
MPCSVHHAPFSESLLDQVARDLWALCPEAEGGDLTGAMVLLPSSRACRTLEHRLLDLELERNGRGSLLLPAILTDRQWAREQAVLLGLDRRDYPDDRLRPLILAPVLARRPWLADRPESAQGLAAEFIRLFDEARFERCDERLLRGRTPLDNSLAASGTEEAEAIRADGARIREVWDLYRGLVPWDAADEQVAVAEALAKGASRRPGPGPAVVLVAGFGKLTRIQADLLRSALEGSAEGRLYLPVPDDPLSRAFCATWGIEADGGGTSPGRPARSGPLGPALAVASSLAGPGDGDAAGAILSRAKVPLQGTLRERLAEVGEAPGLLGPGGRLNLLPCPDPEWESRLAAHLAIEELQAAGTPPRIAIAAPDPRLAARITAQLRDAGVDVDETYGRPLSTLPAGLLVRFILRAALTGLRPEPLLEVLGHPFVRLPVSEGSHGGWTLRLERMFRLQDGPPGGLAGMLRRAEDHDQSVRDFFGRGGAGMASFVQTVGEAFDPLLDLALRGARPWPEHLAALKSTWKMLTTNGEKQADIARRVDVESLGELLAVLEREAGVLPPTEPADFAADLGRLLAEQQVPAHRARNLPVVVTGLLEARLERFDHLILAGINDDVFPSRSPQEHLLTPLAAGRLGLGDWRDHLGREAELFLRLLHNAPRVTVTWSREQEGQDLLPSPFVSRLLLALGTSVEDLGEVPPPAAWRKETAPVAEIRGRQESFRFEPTPVRAQDGARPQLRLSWSALRQWRECPYRYLMERRLALRKEEELRKEFGKQDFGSLVHDALKDWLVPGGEGQKALLAGDEDAALAVLTAAAEGRFGPGSQDLPVRRLWLASFVRAFPGLIAAERTRITEWEPILLEHGFRMGLPEFIAWTRDLAAGVGLDPADPEDLPGCAWDEAESRAGGIELQGTIDRIDRHRTLDAFAVLDYKTGKAPAAKKVQELDDLQVVLYSAALEAGGAEPLPGQARVLESSYYQVSEEKTGPPAKPHLDGASPEGRLLLARGSIRLIELALGAAAADVGYPLLPRERKNEGEAKLPCRYCDLRGVCRLEEHRDRGDFPDVLWRKVDALINRKEGWL